MTPTIGALIGVTVWAALAGLDLVSLLQSLFSRPLVVGAGAGLILGDADSGLRIGLVLELFALDVVPVGSSRYPDFGAATAGAVVFGAATDWPVSLGVSVGIGLALAIAAGASLPVTRRLNARALLADAAGLAAGRAESVVRVHLRCLGFDLARSVIVAILAVAAGWCCRWLGLVPEPGLGQALTWVAFGGAAWAAAHGAMASARSGARWRWAAAGLAAGSLVVAATW